MKGGDASLLPAHLDDVQSDISPVQAVVLVVKIQGHSPPEPGQGQLLADPRGEVVAVDGVAGGVENELVLLCNNSALFSGRFRLFRGQKKKKENSRCFSPLVLAPRGGKEPLSQWD